MIRLHILPVLSLVCFSITQAREQTCDRSSLNTQDVAMCLQVDLGKADRHLNRRYQQLYQSLLAEGTELTSENKDAAKQLKLAQKQWLTFIETDCYAK